VTEFAPRTFEPAPYQGLHRRDRDPAGYWSRWEKSATTFGPAGRVVATVIALMMAAGSLSSGAFLLAPLSLIGVGYLVKEIWRTGWVIPGNPWTRPKLTAAERHALVPRLQDWRRLPAASKAAWIVGALLAVSLAVTWQMSDNFTRGVILMLVTIVAGTPILWWFVRPL
jgi:hypothetical protein